MRPDRPTNNAFLYCLGVAAERLVETDDVIDKMVYPQRRGLSFPHPILGAF